MRDLTVPENTPVQQLAPNVGHCSSVAGCNIQVRVPDLFNAVDTIRYWDVHTEWSSLMSIHFE